MYNSVLNHESSVTTSHTKERVRHGGFGHKHRTHMLNSSNVLNCESSVTNSHTRERSKYNTMKELLIFSRRNHYLLLYTSHLKFQHLEERNAENNSIPLLETNEEDDTWFVNKFICL